MQWNPNAPMAPFSENGSLMDYPGYGKFEYRPALPFKAELYLDKMSRGRSSVQAIWKTSDGRRFPMFVSDLEYLLKNDTVQDGRTLERTWKIVKRGQNYGIQLDD